MQNKQYVIPIDEAIKSAERNMLDADWNGDPSYSGWKYEYDRLCKLRDAGQQFEVLF